MLKQVFLADRVERLRRHPSRQHVVGTTSQQVAVTRPLLDRVVREDDVIGDRRLSRRKILGAIVLVKPALGGLQAKGAKRRHQKPTPMEPMLVEPIGLNDLFITGI